MRPPPRYLGKLDNYTFLRELAVWAVDNGGKQFARDIESLAVHVANQADENKDLKRQIEDAGIGTEQD